MIVVTPLAHLDVTAARHRPSHLLTLLSPDQRQREWRDATCGQHLRLYFHDITEPRDGLVAPDKATVGAILDFAQGWSGAQPMLVHCWAGISRSSAAAFMIACAKNPHHEAEIADELRRRAPFATPNRLMVALADDLLQRDGRMSGAIARIGRGAEAFEGTPYQLPTAFPDVRSASDCQP